MKFSAVLAAGVLSLSSLVAAQTVDLSQVYVENISFGGTGCPRNTVGILLAADKKTFTLLFDSYVAEIGASTRITDTRKNCQITVALHYPQGFQYSLLSTDYRGYVGIDKGVTATQKSTYYFSGDQAQASTETKFVGPQSKNYLIHDEIPFTSTVWAPCGQVQALNINSQILLTSTDSKAEGILTTDSVDGKVSFILGLQWQACPKK